MKTLRDQVIKLAFENPGPIREALLPILKKARREGFEVEVADIGINTNKVGPFYTEIHLYYPLSNIGRRGKRVIHQNYNLMTGKTRYAWDYTFLDKVKKARSLKDVEKVLQDILKMAQADTPEAQLTGGHPWELKGIDQNLPTPSSMKIENIKGVDIFVDMNAKPITIGVPSHTKMLDQSRETYWFRVHQRFQKQLMALAPELKAARGLKAIEKILTAAGIPYDYHQYMQAGWD